MLDSSADPPATIRSRPVLPHWEMLLDASRMMLPREPFKGRERSFLPSGTKRQKDRGGEGRGGGAGRQPRLPPASWLKLLARGTCQIGRASGRGRREVAVV